MVFVLYAVVAAIGGLLVGLIGTGNALVIMPTLAITFPKVLPGEHALRLATGTTMATMAVGAVVVAYVQHRAGRVNLSLLRIAVLPYLLGALSGPWISLYLPSGILKFYLSLIIAAMALILLRAGRPRMPSTRDFRERRAEIFLVLSVIGVCSSVAGIASGIFVIPYLTRFSVPMKTIVATSTASAAFYSVFGTIGYISAGWTVSDLPPATLGFVYLPAFAIMALVVAAVGPLGVRFAHRVDDELLKRMFAVFLLFAATAVLLL